MSRARSAVRQAWPVAAAVVAVIAIWWILAAANIWSRRVLPTPPSVFATLGHHIADGSIPTAAGKTLLRLAFGFGVSILAGTVLGLFLAASSLARRSVGSLVIALQAVPPIALLPLAVLWFGFTERAVVFVVIVGGLPSVTLACLTSLRNVPVLYERAGLTLGARGLTLFRRVIFPAALPGYVAGLQQAWGYAWRALMAGELITHTTSSFGLGQLLARAQDHQQAPQVFAVLFVIVAIGMVVDLVVFRTISRRIRQRRGLTVGG